MSTTENFGLNIEQLKVYFIKGIRYWYVLLLSLIIGGAYGYYKVRYNVPSYTVSGRVLVKDVWKGYGADGFLPGMEIVNERNRLANEMGIIKSFPLMTNVIEDLSELKVSYFDIGNIRRTEMYQSSPFQLLFDSISNNAVYSKDYSLKIIDEKSFALSSSDFEEDDGEKHLFNETLDLEGNKIGITLEHLPPNYDEKKYQFHINNPQSLAKSYQDRTKIYIDMDEASSILVISLDGTNAKKETAVVNSIMQNFIDYGLDQGNEKGVNTLAFVNEQIDNVAHDLILAETKLEAFKKSSNTKRIDYNGENIINQITELEKKKLELQFTIDFSNTTIVYIQENDDAKGIVIPYFINRNSVLYDLMVNLIKKYSTREEYKFTIEEENTAMKLLKNDIAISKSILIENLISLKNKSENDFLIAENQLKFLEQKILETPSTERNYTIAFRDYSIQNKLYTYLLEKRQEAEIATASNIPKASILDYANNYRVRKTSPSSSSIYQKHITTSIILGFLLIVILEMLNNKIIDKSDIENNTNIPIIGQIGHNRDRDNLLLFTSPKSLISEAFRTIRTNVQYLSHAEGCRIILLTSSVGGEGKTFCSMNIASSYALLNKKTLLIGADLRKPRIFDDFGVKNNVGLSSLLIGKTSLEEATQKTNYEHLDLITSGPIPPNPSELLSSPEFTQLINTLKSKYERIILDTSPIGLVTDARLLIDISDVVLLIARQKYTRLPNFIKIATELEKYHDKCGIVINDIQQKTIGYGKYEYSYGYGYGYGNGYGYYSEKK